MKIGIDLRSLQEYSRFRGIGTVTYEITKGLLEYYPDEQYYFYLYKNLPKPDFPEILKKGKVIDFDPNARNSFVRKIVSRISRGQLLIAEDIDVFLATDPHKKLPKGKFRRIVIFYDIINLLFTQKYLLTITRSISIDFVKLLKFVRFQLTKKILLRNFRSAVKADRILAISQTTKSDIIRFFEIPEEQITLMHLAADKKFTIINNDEEETFRRKFVIKHPFLLYIGGLDFRKNVLNLIRAVNILGKKGNFPYQLVIVGKDVSRKNMPEAMEIKRYLDKENLWKTVRLIDFVDTDDMVKFYNFAKAFVFPSFYEGFGLPVLESMQCGTPVLCSNTSATREVGGDSVLYFDPRSPEDIAEKIEELLNDRVLQKTLVKKGIQQSQEFSWKKAVDIVYQSFTQ